MANEQKHETLKDLEQKLENARKKEKYLNRQLTILEKGVVPQLTRAARTNRLCTRAGMLESFLSHPELLSNDQVMELLKIAFRQKPVKDTLTEMLKTVVPSDASEDP